MVLIYNCQTTCTYVAGVAELQTKKIMLHFYTVSYRGRTEEHSTYFYHNIPMSITFILAQNIFTYSNISSL